MSKFDTVIIDDASLMPESDILQTLKHGARRLVLLGNCNIEQNMFLLNPKSDRTLFQRVLSTIGLENCSLPPRTVSVKTEPKASPPKRGKKQPLVVKEESIPTSGSD